VPAAKAKPDDVDPIPPPDYAAQLASMGYTPPPPPQAIGGKAPWSPQVKTKLPLFPSIASEAMEPKGSRLIEKLREENKELKTVAKEAAKAAAFLERRVDKQQAVIDGLRIELRDERRGRNRVDQPMAKRLEAMERRAKGDDLEDIEESELIAWWRDELSDCSGALVRGLTRLLNLAARGIDVQTIKPRKPKRPGIQRDQ
jgi:hypothetical protein